MKKNHFSFGSFLLGICLVASGCTAASTQPGLNVVSVYQGTAKELIKTEDKNPSAQRAASAANSFSFRLSEELLKGNNDTNFICSPYSVWMPMAALLNGTTPEYQEELLEALTLTGLTAEDVNIAASRMLYDLRKVQQKEAAEKFGEDYYEAVKIANAVLISKDKPLKKDFAQQFLDYYRGTVMLVDFNTEEAVKVLNQWVSENTQGQIPSIVDDLNPDSAAVIANAVYFSDRWDWSFNKSKTTEGPFYGKEETKASYMVHEGDHDYYYEDELVQSVVLEFKTGGSMMILLPKDGNGNKLLGEMNNDYFEAIWQGMDKAKGKFSMPKFQIQSDVMDITDTLSAMGIPLFDSEKAALTGGIVEGTDPFYLSGSIHKALIEVDEEGATAAAVTVFDMEVAAPPPEILKTFEMDCNSPFVFILCEKTKDGGSQVLFTGVVNEPTIIK